jgi:hypothetical protein
MTRFAAICRKFEAQDLKGLALTLKEVSFIKLFCDAYFLAKIRPKALKALGAEQDHVEEGSEPEQP